MGKAFRSLPINKGWGGGEPTFLHHPEKTANGSGFEAACLEKWSDLFRCSGGKMTVRHGQFVGYRYATFARN